MLILEGVTMGKGLEGCVSAICISPPAISHRHLLLKQQNAAFKFMYSVYKDKM
jgi:hypothetical protein